VVCGLGLVSGPGRGAGIAARVEESASGRGGAATSIDDAISRTRLLRFPRDHGSHPGARTEWWYLTGWLAAPERRDAIAAGSGLPDFGFQVTFFRSRTDLAPDHPSRFAARQLLFAHLALTDLRRPEAARLRHDQRVARAGLGIAEAALDDTRVHIRDWSIERRGDASATAAAADGTRYRVRMPSEPARLDLELELRATQPVLLQGDGGFSRKGPLEAQASHYYSQPQLAAAGRLRVDGQPVAAAGTAWLDHEWSETLLAPDAQGWDWIGMNLFDGSALTAFRLRRADGRSLWAGGSWRAAPSPRPGAMSDTSSSRVNGPTGRGAAPRAFGPEEVQFVAGRRWRSPASNASYPVEWQVLTPAGRFGVRALLDGQELDSRGSTGAIYWEGLSELLDDGGRRVGLGYLEMTGYAARLQL
jgi:predicted secreted hydrolase